MVNVRTSVRYNNTPTHDATYVRGLVEPKSSPDLVEVHVLRELPSIEQHMIGEIFGVLARRQ